MHYKQFAKLIRYLASGVWAIPAVLLVRALRPLILIRFATIDPMRIGHFVQDFGIRFAKREVEKSNSLDLYYLQSTKDGLTSNQFWETLVKRHFHIGNSFKYLFQWNQIIPGGRLHTGELESTDKPRSRDINGYLEKCERKMRFLPEEEATARQWLMNQGWKQGEKFVCLLIRDGAFLAGAFPSVDYSYHSYRNSDPANFTLAAEWLAEQGAWVLRMGSSVEQHFQSSNARIIDYALCSTKSPFLDIWLFANCDLCVTTGSGPDAVSDVFRRPTLFVDYLPLCHMRSWSEFIAAPKRLKWAATGEELTLTEYIDADFLESNLYEKSGISITPLSPKEILQATQELWDRSFEEWTESEYSIKSQRDFWSIFSSHRLFSDYHGFIHPKAKISQRWLENTRDDFFR